jgi:hypothetical protein
MQCLPCISSVTGSRVDHLLAQSIQASKIRYPSVTITCQLILLLEILAIVCFTVWCVASCVDVCGVVVSLERGAVLCAGWLCY